MSLDTGILVALEDLNSRWWVAYAACNQPDVDPDIFFPERGLPGASHASEAKAVCATCDVRTECLDYALRPGQMEKFGVWGGTTEKERRAIRQQRRAARLTGTVGQQEAAG